MDKPVTKEFNGYLSTAQRCLERYDFGAGMKLMAQGDWELESSAFRNPVCDVGALRVSCGIDLGSEDSPSRVRADFWVIFDIDSTTGKPDAGKPTTIVALDTEDSEPLGSPVGLPQYFKTRIVVDVLTFAQPGDIGVTVPKDPSGALDCVIAYMQDDVREGWKACMGTVNMGGWNVITNAEAASFAESLDDSIDDYFGSLKPMMDE